MCKGNTVGNNNSFDPKTRGRKLRDIAASEASEDLGLQEAQSVSVARATDKRKPMKKALSNGTKPFARDLLEIRPDETGEMDPYIGSDDDVREPSARVSNPLADPRSDRHVKVRRSVASKH